MINIVMLEQILCIKLTRSRLGCYCRHSPCCLLRLGLMDCCRHVNRSGHLDGLLQTDQVTFKNCFLDLKTADQNKPAYLNKKSLMHSF